MDSITVDEALINQVAKNSCLNLSQEEITEFTTDFVDVLKHFEKIAQATVSDKPSFHPIPSELFSQNYRKDMPGEVLSQKQALKNVTESTEEGHIRGPKVV